MMKDFSVLMSVYAKEQPKWLRLAAESVFSQTLKPAEVVLVEDGTLTEELETAVQELETEHTELKVIRRKENQGLGYALNEGLKNCSHELVARMDTDDICKPWRFERQVDFMERNPDVAVLGAWIDEFTENINNIKSIRKTPQENAEIYEFGKRRNPINHPVVMFRKSAVEDSGGYLPIPLFEDYYLWARMLVHGYKFHNIQESLLYFRCSPDMYKRRGGIKYALVEIKFQRILQEIGYVSCARACKNICIRFATRIMPNSLRAWIYETFARK